MRRKKVDLPVEEWDFQVCSENERAACLHYEYAREYVQSRPDLAAKLAGETRPSPYNHRLKFIVSDKCNPDSLPMICPEFPVVPWLALPPETRAQLIALCQMLPEEDESNSNLLVEDDFDVSWLQDLDEHRKALFAKWMQDNRDRHDRESVGLRNGDPFTEPEIERHALCNGPRRYYAVSKHLALAVIQLDWSKSDSKLNAAFQRLLKRRPKNVVPVEKVPQQGGRGGPADQLKALGAKRLWSYYGSSEDAVEAIERICFEAGRKPPYTDADALSDAAPRVENTLKNFETSGRFRAFADL